MKDPEEQSLVIECGLRIKKIREDAHLTQEEFGRKLGCTASCIGQCERGRHKMNYRQLLLICTEYDTTLDYLLRGIDYRVSPNIPPSVYYYYNNADPDDLLFLNESMSYTFKQIDLKHEAIDRIVRGDLAGMNLSLSDSD